MNELVSLFFEIAVLTYVFIFAWELKSDIRKYFKSQELLFERIADLYREVDYIYKMLIGMQEDQKK